MIGFFLNIVLALCWVALTGSFGGLNFIFGFALGYIVIAIVQHQLPSMSGYAQRLPLLLRFAGFFIKELVKANYKVGFDILTPPWHMQPGVIAFPLEAKSDFEITMVANFISLTPGTLTLDISDDRRVLFIHAMFLQDEKALLTELHEVERRLLEILR